MSNEKMDKKSYAMGWWNAMSACRDYGIPTKPNQPLKECCLQAIKEYKIIFFCDCDNQPDKGNTCKDCGKFFTDAEGASTFTVCDDCWDKNTPTKMKLC